MNDFFKKIPVPITGLMLGAAALGNLVKDRGEIFRDMLGIVSVVIFIMLVIKIIKNPGIISAGLDNPVVGGVMATFPMGMMILSTYIKPLSSRLAFGFWVAGIMIHLALIIAFSIRYLLKFNIRKVFTTYFIMYVGIVAASVSAPAHNMLKVGETLFWFGFTAYIILLPIVLYRVFVIKEIPAPALPTLVVLSAPGSLCLAGYLSTFEVKNPTMVLILLVLASINIILALGYLPRLVLGPFVPAFSAFTFPLVISAIAIKMANGFYAASGNPISLLAPSALVLEIISVLIVLFVLIRYTQYMIKVDEILEAPAKA
jgi:exfoliative toxin A/B